MPNKIDPRVLLADFKMMHSEVSRLASTMEAYIMDLENQVAELPLEESTF